MAASASSTYALTLASREEEQLGRAYDTPSLLPRHKIFISHSGRQKDFAEQLCQDLETHGYFPFFDKRSDSLPKGKMFPPLIFKAAEECLLAIVLISEDFFTRTKWPMLELAAFVKAQKTREDLCILPVLLGLTTEDLRNTKKWSKSWAEWGEQDQRLTKNVICEWEAAVQSLRRWNMILKSSYDGECKLRKGIIQAIMRTMPPNIRSDVSNVQGRARICKEVCATFDRCPPSTSMTGENAKVLGVYGIGGAGKTTLCVIMTEYLRSYFVGRVCVIELGREVPIVDLHRQVLRKLCKDDPDFLNKHIDTEREGLNRLKELICRERVFLAIDNVSDDLASINTARSYLRLKFHPNSMVLVTSRSDEVLCGSLGIPVQSCMRCLSTTKEEALQLLLEQVNLSVKVLDGEQMQALHKAVKLSDFQGYHPLALKLFAAQLGTDQFKWKGIQLDVEWTSDLEHPLFSKIETNYLRLPDQHTKDIFMDIALFTPEYLCGLDDIICWLTDTTGLDAECIKQKLGILRIKSLLEVWRMEDETFRCHDLYRVLAQRNASAHTVSPRFIYQKGGIAAPKVLLDNGQSRKIERATFVDAEFEMLCLEACTDLKVLSTRRCEKLRALSIQGLSCLVSLELAACAVESLELSGFSSLRWLHISSCKDLMHLDASKVEHLQHVNVSKCSKLIKLDFKSCSMVRSVSFKYNAKLCHVNLGDGSSLECLTLWFCGLLDSVEISGVAYLTTLKKRGCPRLLAMQQGGDIMCRDAQYLSLEKWGRLSPTFVRGLESSASLRVLDIWNSCMSRLPDLRSCLCLQELRLTNVDVMLELNNRDLSLNSSAGVLLEEYEKIMCFRTNDWVPPKSLKHLKIQCCKDVVVKEILWKVQGLGNLQVLSLQDVRVGWDWELYNIHSNLYSQHKKMARYEEDQTYIDRKKWRSKILAMLRELSMNLQFEFSCELQNVACCLKTIKHCLLGIFEGRNPSTLSMQAELIEQDLTSKNFFECMFENRIRKIVCKQGSMAWFLEQIILKTFDNCDSLCKFLQQELTSESAAHFVESCQKGHVKEICAQLHFSTARRLSEIVQHPGVLRSWEMSMLDGPFVSENGALAITRLEDLLERLDLLCACRGWQVDQFEKLQERMQSAQEWLGTCVMFLSLEELTLRLHIGQSEGRSELESHLDDMQELLRCNAAMLKAEMENFSEDIVTSNSLGRLIRYWKVRRWLQEVESCLSKHLTRSCQALREVEEPHSAEMELFQKELSIAEPFFLHRFLFLEERARRLFAEMNLENLSGAESLYWDNQRIDKKQRRMNHLCQITKDYLKEVREFLGEIQEMKLGMKCPRSFLDLVIQLDLQQYRQYRNFPGDTISIGGKMSRCIHALELYTGTSVEGLHGGYGASVWPHIRQSSLDIIEALSEQLTIQIGLMVLISSTPSKIQHLENSKRIVKHISLSLRDELNVVLQAQIYSRIGEECRRAELEGVWERARLTSLWNGLRNFMTCYEDLLGGPLLETLQELLKDLHNVFEVPYPCAEAEEKDFHKIGKLGDLIGEAGGSCSVARSGYISDEGRFRGCGRYMQSPSLSFVEMWNNVNCTSSTGDMFHLFPWHLHPISKWGAPQSLYLQSQFSN